MSPEQEDFWHKFLKLARTMKFVKVYGKARNFLLVGIHQATSLSGPYCNGVLFGVGDKAGGKSIIHLIIILILIVSQEAHTA